MTTFDREFPDFPAADMPAIPEGFVDVSWKNDSCPSFLNVDAGLVLFVDYLDPELREEPTCPRFSLGVWDDGSTGWTLAATDDWAEILAALPAAPDAAHFLKGLGEELTANQWREMLRLNATPEFAGDCCASHNFVDANMVMFAALTAVDGHEPDVSDQAVLDRMNAAWALATPTITAYKPATPAGDKGAPHQQETTT